MARFSLGREEDEPDNGSRPGSSSSSRPRPKKQKTTSAAVNNNPPPSVPPPPQVPAPPQLGPRWESEEEEEDIGEEASDYEIAEEFEESYDSDFEEEEEDEDEGLENEDIRANEEGSDRDGYVSVTLTDPDVLDCPICLENLSIPVFQCDNGHVACSSCCLRIGNRCPSCSLPIGYSRCRAIEKVIESVKIPCQNLKYGCNKVLKFCDKLNHEKLCTFTPCFCPLLDCNYANSFWRLYVHFSSKHFSSASRFPFNQSFSVGLERNQKFLILHAAGGMIFIVNHFSEQQASKVSVNCIGPPLSRREFSYEIMAKEGETSIKFVSFVENIRRWSNIPPARNFFLVPNHYAGSSGQLKLEICIRNL